MRTNDPILIQQGQLSLHLQHSLDHEHHIRTTRIIFVEGKTHRMLDCPWQNAFAEFRDLFSVLQHDRVLADEVDTADMRIEINAHTGPVQPRGHLLDMGGFSGAVIALDKDAAVVGEPRENRQGGFAVEHVSGVEVRHIFVRPRKCGYGQGHVEAKRIPHIHHHVRRCGGIKTICGHHSSIFEDRRNPQRPARRSFSLSGAGLRFNSRETGSPKMAVGFDDLSQPLFRAAVAAIGIGMKPLHEFLIPGLYLVQAGGLFKVEYGQRVQLGFGQGRPAPRLRRRCSFFKNGKTILEMIGELRRTSCLCVGRALAERPCRAVSGHRIQAETLDFGTAHTFEEIPAFVVLPQMRPAEPLPVFQVGPGFGHIAFGRLAAAWRRTWPTFGGDGLRARRIDANIVAKARAICGRRHDGIMGCEV